MPTPVSTARQCLTDEAARALDDAVAVARRRSHSQTTSLHAVSALLALPSSAVREACARARSCSYSPRLQFRALEFCVGVSLDRLPASKAVAEEPPVSNSLMAAIKRSQANQRRHPETFYLYQQMQQYSNCSQSSLSCVKVELKHFILSILDDPIVSRVFGDAGFRSCDIKFAILHPPPISRFTRSRLPPLFLCNLTDSESSRRGFSFPFTGFPGPEIVDENSRRIGEILAKKTGKNPILIGVCAKDALNSFVDCLRREKSGLLPAELDGLSLTCLEKDIVEFVAQDGSEAKMEVKFHEIVDSVGKCSGPGIVVNLGDLKVLIGDGPIGSINFLVSRLTALLEAYGGELWLIGAVGSYETYTKFLAQFPSVERNWDLQTLPITSSKPSVGGLYPKSSLMGSFVPLGGFFSAPSESSSTNQFARCDLCNEKYEQESSIILKGGSTNSVAEQYSASLSSCIQIAECETSENSNVLKAKDDGTVLNAKLMGLQQKWNDICQRLHPTRPFDQDTSQPRFPIQGVEGFQFVSNRKEISGNYSLPKEGRSSCLSSYMPVNLRESPLPRQDKVLSVASEAENASLKPKLLAQVSRSQQLGMEKLPPLSPLQNLRLASNCTSPSSITSVTTDLGLGTINVSNTQGSGNPKSECCKARLHHFSGSVSAGYSENACNIDRSSSCSGPELQEHAKSFKSLWRALSERVGWQDEAICQVSQAVSHFRSENGRHKGSSHRGDIWLSFLGADKVGKMRVAAALAEVFFGARESLISVDLSKVDWASHSNSIFDCQQAKSCVVKMRGKTVVDYIAEELSRKPHSVVLLENIDKADFLAQNSLSQAITTRKFPDSHGREIGMNNAIFVTTADFPSSNKEIISGGNVEFSEARILRTKGWQIQIMITNATDSATMHRKECLNQVSVKKRKLIDMNDSAELDMKLKMPKLARKASKSCLDLNLPADASEEETYSEISNDDSYNERSESWLENFLDQVDKTVVFKPFDFDALAREILKDIAQGFRRTIGHDVLLEIDEEVVVQVLAAAWLTNQKRVVDWVEQVLIGGFTEAKQRYPLSPQSIVKLVACEGLLAEEKAPGICLPAKIMLN